MKFYKYWVILACLGLIAGSFLPIAYYPDLNKVFTGFFSENNLYGKPGKLFIFIAVASVILAFVNKAWAKGVNLLFAAVNVAFYIKTYVLFTSCANGLCPEKRYGLYVLMGATVLLLVTALLPDLKIASKDDLINNGTDSQTKSP